MFLRYKKCIGIFFLLIASCTFDTGNNDPLVMTRIGNLSDTTSIWPQLMFVFSVPLEDTIIDIQITPNPGPVYDTYLTPTKDTVYLKVTGSLEGNTPYIITLKHVLTAENGSKLYPDDAIFDIITYPKEYEPNNDNINADTLLTVRFGVISPVHDTDFYCIVDSTSTTIYLTSHDKKAGVVIKDIAENVIMLDDGFEVNKIISIGDSSAYPLYAGVFSLLGNDTRYEIGIIK